MFLPIYTRLYTLTFGGCWLCILASMTESFISFTALPASELRTARSISGSRQGKLAVVINRGVKTVSHCTHVACTWLIVKPSNFDKLNSTIICSSRKKRARGRTLKAAYCSKVRKSIGKGQRKRSRATMSYVQPRPSICNTSAEIISDTELDSFISAPLLFADGYAKYTASGGVFSHHQPL